MSASDKLDDATNKSIGVFCDLIVKTIYGKADELRDEFAVQIAALRAEMNEKLEQRHDQ